mgnify:CR=1 FL=1
MHKIADVEIAKNIMDANDRLAHKNLHLLEDHDIFCVDFVGAIGSGKTALIEDLIDNLDEKVGVLAGDIISDFDAERIKSHNAPVVGLNTGTECHLDAHLVGHGLADLPLDDIDYLFIENVGNLICPVDFQLGSHMRVVVVSVTEGDDTVEKHPIIFQTSDVVVINKIDKPSARPAVVIDQVLDLFIDLGADDDQLEFKVVYTSAVNFTSSLSEDPEAQEEGMSSLLDMVLKEIPDPDNDIDSSLQFQPALLDYNDYVGRIGIGRVKRGKISLNQMVSCVRIDGSITNFRIQKLFNFEGIKRNEVEVAYAGEIIGIAGLPDIYVGETVCEQNNIDPLPLIHVSEPTVQMNFGTNTSPFVGRDGKILTARKIEERLFKETQSDVSLKVERVENKEEWVVSGRGELHLSILIENLRREGYEFQVSRPKVILKEIDGVLYEPYEDVVIDVPDEYVGPAIEMLGTRRGILISMDSKDSQTRLTYVVPSKGLIGFSTEFMTATHGYGIMNHVFSEFKEVTPDTYVGRKQHVLVSINSGSATAYACGQIEDRGELFIAPGEEVYEGMIVGICNREEDLAVNITRAKQMTNQRSSTKDSTVVLKAPRQLSLENYLEFIDDDELVEITPHHIRLRKVILDTVERKKFDARNK